MAKYTKEETLKKFITKSEDEAFRLAKSLLEITEDIEKKTRVFHVCLNTNLQIDDKEIQKNVFCDMITSLYENRVESAKLHFSFFRNSSMLMEHSREKSIGDSKENIHQKYSDILHQLPSITYAFLDECFEPWNSSTYSHKAERIEVNFKRLLEHATIRFQSKYIEYLEKELKEGGKNDLSTFTGNDSDTDEILKVAFGLLKFPDLSFSKTIETLGLKECFHFIINRSHNERTPPFILKMSGENLNIMNFLPV